MKILKVVGLLLLLHLPLNVLAHKDSTKVNINGYFSKNIQEFKKGTSFHFDYLYHDSIKLPNEYFEDYYTFLSNSTNRKILVIDKNRLDEYMNVTYDNIQDLCDAKLITGVIYNKEKKGPQYDLRKEMEDEALDYIDKVREYDLELNDPYLYDYIYSLLLKLTPEKYIDGREYDVNVLIQKSSDINACMYPNGTMVINTGLLSILHSEDELVGVLAHEFGHFLMDHCIINVNKAVTRKKRAAFWASLLTGVTAVTEGVAASNGHYYTPGLGTLAMATMATEISKQVVDHLGMKFNHEQEYEADMFARDVLKILGYNENALATALDRIGQQCRNEEKYSMYLESYSHPDLYSRIKNLGTPVEMNNIEYEQKVSFAVSYTAMIKFVNRRFRECLPLVSQNIDNNVANADDYLLKANCILATKNNEDSNKEVSTLINKAKAIEPENINVYKSEILLSFRLNDIDKSIILLEDYKELLKSMDNKSLFVREESKWIRIMLIKLRGMKMPLAV